MVEQQFFKRRDRFNFTVLVTFGICVKNILLQTLTRKRIIMLNYASSQVKPRDKMINEMRQLAAYFIFLTFY